MNIIKLIVKNRYLILVILLATLLRFYQLGNTPPSLNADEAAIGYNAYSILKTGRDEFGERFPLAFRSFDDYKAPLYIYLTVPCVSLFGLSDFAVRFPSAILGTLTVLFTYFMVKQLDKLKNSGIPLLSAFILAISPWHLQFSRSAYEANIAVFFIVFGVYAFLKGLKQYQWMYLGAVSLALSLWSYHAPRVFVPLLGICLLFLYRKELLHQWKNVAFSICLFTIVILPLFFILISPQGMVRARGVSSITDPAILNKSIEWIKTDQHNTLSLLFHNRRFEYAKVLITGYLSHFDPAFLFLEKTESKYHAPEVGLLYLWELPFIVYGFLILFSYDKRFFSLILWWIIISPIAASPTLRLPHPVRTIIFLPAFQILTAVGLAQGYEACKRYFRIIQHIYKVGMFFIIVLFLSFYLHQYYVHMPIDYSADWQYGRKQVYTKVEKFSSLYDHIVISTTLDMPHIFFLYYSHYDPSVYLAAGGTKSGKFDAEDNVMGKYIFKSIARAYGKYPGMTLYVGEPSELPDGAVIRDTVYYLNQKPAFIIFD